MKYKNYTEKILKEFKPLTRDEELKFAIFEQLIKLNSNPSVSSETIQEKKQTRKKASKQE